MEHGATLIIVPVLRRPHRVAPLLHSIRQATPEPHRVLFGCTDGDQAEIAAVDKAGADRFTIPWARGDYARKINHGYRDSTEPVMFLAADDLHFHPGWLTACLDQLDPGVGVVGTNDLTNRRTATGHSTHTLVTRAYADEHGTVDGPGEVLHEGYWHEFCDDELVVTARHRDAYRHAPHALVEHLHPMAGKAPMDDLYAEQADRMRAGRKLYQRRQPLWT